MDKEVAEYFRNASREKKEEFEALCADPRRKAAFDDDLRAWRMALSTTTLLILNEIDPTDAQIQWGAFEGRMESAEDLTLFCLLALILSAQERQLSEKLEQRRKPYIEKLQHMFAIVERALITRVTPTRPPGPIYRAI